MMYYKERHSFFIFATKGAVLYGPPTSINGVNTIEILRRMSINIVLVPWLA
jgi:hypothetical protein